MRVVRTEAHRRISFLIAAASMKRKLIGALARGIGAVPVSRAQDMKKPGAGRIYLPDPDSDPKLLRGIDTNFESPEYQVGGLIMLPTIDGSTPQAEIAEIRGPEEIYLKREFKGSGPTKLLTGKISAVEANGETNGQNGQSNNVRVGDFQGCKFKVAPKVDQTQVYNEVFKRLDSGGCIGIFPEGGSHDRTELLPLKGKSSHIGYF
jgi:glycerol-3-phosphate O-acyltransferase/dihydroxyacetone phosphate acyltransferase